MIRRPRGRRTKQQLLSFKGEGEGRIMEDVITASGIFFAGSCKFLLVCLASPPSAVPLA